MKELEHKTLAFEVKDVGELGTFKGYASTFNNIDLDGDRILPGAFKRTLDHTKGEVPILWQHRYDEPIGKNLVAREDEHGLYVEGMLDMNVQKAREAHSLMKNGIIKGLSIGFRPIQVEPGKEGAKRDIKEIALSEYSVVTFPANPEAGVANVKNGEEVNELPVENKGATAFQNFPIAEKDRTWSAGQAVKRCRVWAGGPDKEKVDWKKLAKCFMYVDDVAKDFGAFHLPYVDIVDGTPHVIPHALHAVESRLSSTDIPSDAKKVVLEHVQSYLKKLEKPGDKPDEGKGAKMPELDFESKAMDFLDAFHRAKTSDDLWKMRRSVEEAKENAVASVYGDNNLSHPQKHKAIKDIYMQYGDAMTEFHKAHLKHVQPNGTPKPNGSNDNDADDKLSEKYVEEVKSQIGIPNEKTGRRISSNTASMLKQIVAHHEKGVACMKDAMAAHQMGMDACKALAEGESVDDTYDSPDGVKPVPMGQKEDHEFLKSLLSKMVVA